MHSKEKIMGTPLHVLIVEDSEDDLLLMIHEIRSHGYDLTYVRVETPEDMREALLNHTWDVILSDYSMPRFSALAAIKLVQDMGIDAPIIIVSGTVGEEAAVAAMKAGAQDFFSKHRLVRLIPAIERELRETDDRRKRLWAEEQLHHAEQRFSKVFQAGPLGITITNRNGVFLDVNDFLLRESGYSRSEVIGKSSLELNFWLDVETRKLIAQVLDTGNIVRDMELQFRDKSGQMHDVLCSFTRIELAGQACLLSMFQDITERKRMEAERSRLLEQKQAATQEFQMTIERMTDGFVMLDREWRFRYVNPKAIEMLGRRAANLIGFNAWQIFPEAVDGPYYNALHKAAATQTTVEIEAYFEPWKRWFVNRIFPSPDGITIFFRTLPSANARNRKFWKPNGCASKSPKSASLFNSKNVLFQLSRTSSARR